MKSLGRHNVEVFCEVIIDDYFWLRFLSFTLQSLKVEKNSIKDCDSNFEVISLQFFKVITNETICTRIALENYSNTDQQGLYRLNQILDASRNIPIRGRKITKLNTEIEIVNTANYIEYGKHKQSFLCLSRKEYR